MISVSNSSFVFNFWRKFILFSTMAAQIYIHTNRTPKCPFLYIVTSICYLLPFIFIYFSVVVILTGERCIYLMISDVKHCFLNLLFTCPHGKEPASQCRRGKRHGFNPWVRKIPCVGNSYPLQHSCLENSKDRGAWWAIAHGVTESDTTEAV